MTRSAQVTAALTGRPAACIALAFLVVCSRAWLIGYAGSGVPFWDQWDAEAAGLYIPWIEGRLQWSDLFQPHNEHRIALTRVADLILFVGLGTWNPWAQLFLNALLHALTASTLIAILWKSLTSGARAFLMAGTGIFFTATCGWQNALWGFQSQVYFGTLLTVIAVGGLVGSAPFTIRWWWGWVAATLGLFANAGGILAALAVAGASLLSGRVSIRRAAPWLALGAIVAAGVALRVDAPHHGPLHARNVMEFWAVFTRCLAWPHVNQGWWAMAMQAPLAGLLIQRWRSRQPLDTAERCAVALALFAVFHAAAVAYSRGAGLPDHRPLSRYQDPLLLGAVAQLYALARINRSRLPALIWSGLMLVGLLNLTSINLTLHLPHKRTQDRAAAELLRAYQQSRDVTILRADPALRSLHPSNPESVTRMLMHPTLQPYLPAEVRATHAVPVPAPAAHGAALTIIALTLLGTVVALLVLKPYPFS